jgi:hypothetical protein
VNGHLSDNFNEFWQMYPRKVDKQRAIRAWCRQANSLEVVESIMAGLTRQLQSQDWRERIARDPERRFIPHAATWLNGRRWEDEMGPAAVRANVAASPLDELLDRCSAIKAFDRQWFKGAGLHGDTVLVGDEDSLDWIRRHFAETLSRAHGRELTIHLRRDQKNAGSIPALRDCPLFEAPADEQRATTEPVI